MHVVTAWMGNSQRVAVRHYLMTTDSDFDRAVRIPTQTATPTSSQRRKQRTGETEQRENSEDFKACPVISGFAVEPKGLEPSTSSLQS